MKSRYLSVFTLLTTIALSSVYLKAEQRNFKITNPDQGHIIFTKALNNKNLEQLVAMYADDAVMIAPGNQRIKGKKAIRAFFLGTLDRFEGITLDTVFRVNYADTVVFRSKYTVKFKMPDGKIVSQTTSGIEVERKQEDGSWLFVVDHHYGGADYTAFLQLNKSK